MSKLCEILLGGKVPVMRHWKTRNYKGALIYAIVIKLCHIQETYQEK